LNGSETRVGGNINIPIAIKIEATTRSMIIKGKKITNPIMNAL
jgi:hypothetical protein